MNGAVELYKAAKKHGIKPIVGCEIYFVDDHTERGQGRAQPPDAAGLVERRATATSSSSARPASSRGSAAASRRSTWRSSRRTREGLIALTGCLASRFSSRLVEGRDAEARAHADDLLQVFGPENVYFEVQKNGIAEQDQANEGIVADRARGRPPARRHRRRALPAQGGPRTTTRRCCACRRSRTLAAPKMTFDTNEFYLRSNEEMAQAFAEWPEALASTLEIAERCDVEIELGEQLIPRFLPEGEDERAYLRERVDGGPARALRRPAARPTPSSALEMELGVIDRMGFNAYFLIVWDFVDVREGQRDRRRPGPRLGGRLDRRLLPADHRRRPAPLRPAVRALPQRRARVDAGHRHRLLRPRPRARDALRDREVRPRVGRADHHLRQDVPARGHARRRARPRPRLRRRRPAREADPGPDHGPLAELRGLPQGRRAAARRLRQRPDRQADRRRRARASRGSSATRRSTPPRSSSPTGR